MSATEPATQPATEAVPSVSLAALVSEAQAEVSRQMTICNACRYCEGLCAVFPAMERRRTFGPGDVDYLANLCHGCGACYYDCQYAPPHAFAVNVPVALAAAREESYARHATPVVAKRLFERNGSRIAALTAVAVAVFVGGFVAWSDPAALFASGSEPGAFYRVMPHNVMALLFGAVFVFALVAMAASVLRFNRYVAAGAGAGAGTASPGGLKALASALHDAARLRYLDGGGMGCMHESERPSDARRRYHHYTFYGFMLCLASTTTGTIAHYVFAWQAPYPWWSPTVVLGTLGGIGLVVGPLGLLRERARRDDALRPPGDGGLAAAFLWMLLATSVTGLALLVLRATPAMGLLLAVHLGVVFALFATMPYGKFVHGLYRTAAIVRHVRESSAKT